MADAAVTSIAHVGSFTAVATAHEPSKAAASLFSTQGTATGVDLLHVLTRVNAVCRERPQIAGLLHVMINIDSFLYYHQLNHKTLEDAVADDNLHLLRRLLADATHQMSSSYQHPFYLGLQITRAARMAVEKQRASSHFKQFLSCLHAVNPEAVGANEVFAETAAAGDLELIQWLHANCPSDSEFVDSSEAAMKAGGNGHIHMLEWLFANRWSPCSKFPLKEAVENSQHDVLKWLDGQLQQHPVQLFIESSAFQAAAGRGDVEMLTWLFDHPRDESVTYAGNAAAANGHVGILDWLYEFHRDEAQCYLNGYVGAARNGHLDVLQWLYSHYPKRHWSETMEAAAEAGHLEIVKFLHEQRDEEDTIAESGYLAATGGHLEVVKFLFEFYPAECDQVMQLAGGSGNLELVQWLHETHGQSFCANMINFAVYYGRINVLEYVFPRVKGRGYTWTICNAARGNQMHVMEWLHAKLTEENSPWASTEEGIDRWHVTRDGTAVLPVTFAAKNGNLEMVEWLDANNYGACTTSAMNWAAFNGHLGVVKWLHENRTEGCTSKAMDKAAESGHLEVVKWLHDNRTEGCTTDAVDLAVHNGHARVVEFLLKNRSEGCTSAAARDAIEVRRDAELIHLLFEYRRDLIDVESVRAHAEGNEEMLRWLREVGEKGLGRDD